MDQRSADGMNRPHLSAMAIALVLCAAAIAVGAFIAIGFMVTSPAPRTVIELPCPPGDLSAKPLDVLINGRPTKLGCNDSITVYGGVPSS